MKNTTESYASTLNNMEKNTKYTKKNYTSTNQYLKNGYTIINKNKNTNHIEITHAYNYESKKNELTLKNYNKAINSMISNWNKYRDDINEILGDISPYYNYKEEIQKMVDEDNYILEELYKRKHNISSDYDSDYNSDDEDNKYLIY